MATIKSKIIVNVLILFLAIVSIVGMEIKTMSDLGKMQDDGAKRSQDAVDAKEAARGGVALYQIIADAEINRELEKSAKDWSVKKAEVIEKIDQTIKLADTPEEQKLGGEAKKAVQEIVDIFESKMLPALKATDMITADIRNLCSAPQLNRTP